jgi:lipopolysaccharide/colanic/teichoic acid biosynthesis glycosyltransferase
MEAHPRAWVAAPAGARSRGSLAAKRALDIAVAATGIVLLAPAAIAIAVAIRLDSRGPVFFRQRRIGRGGREFRIIKFRSMAAGAEESRPTLVSGNGSNGTFKIPDDPRLTRAGRALRRSYADELPQLWNVLRGEMSLVGPRPLPPEEDALIAGPGRRRLDLRPGITGPWQVRGSWRVPLPEMVELDRRYVAERTLRGDAKLLVRTLPVVLARRGA